MDKCTSADARGPQNHRTRTVLHPQGHPIKAVQLSVDEVVVASTNGLTPQQYLDQMLSEAFVADSFAAVHYRFLADTSEDRCVPDDYADTKR